MTGPGIMRAIATIMAQGVTWVHVTVTGLAAAAGTIALGNIFVAEANTAAGDGGFATESSVGALGRGAISPPQRNASRRRGRIRSDDGATEVVDELPIRRRRRHHP